MAVWTKGRFLCPKMLKARDKIRDYLWTEEPSLCPKFGTTFGQRNRPFVQK